ncbi:pyridoxal-dependent decarboxylase domain-containing protein 1-like isoform X2 [Mya arenaria]|uniref:pyridoxal-dependent decarboxylase domain-containing protein 1-like isoform X2 n=1 Tax=Mya arenaria TaxID=6604 RepID=UPI0022E8A520|nr:pyridoxal-dependent decarboxylase domain-containing protein 1-like isoform X2 [Mya arenaria]
MSDEKPALEGPTVEPDSAHSDSKETPEETSQKVQMPPLPKKTPGPRPGGTGQPEEQFNMFMNPMFAEMEEQVKKQTAILDKINEDMQREKEINLREKTQAHLPEQLRGRGQPIDDVMKKVHELIAYDFNENEPEQEEKKEMGFFEMLAASRSQKNPELHDEGNVAAPAPKVEVAIRKLDEYGMAAVTSHSLAAYISCLPPDHLRKFTSKISMECQLWLNKMFRFEEGQVCYTETPSEGLIRVCRLALYQKYPKYLTEGFEALYSRPPVFYISSAAHPALATYICQQLGLPASAICSVPCASLLGCSSKMRPNKHERMDTEILEKLIEDDIAAAKTPVGLVAYAGTPNIGHVDDMDKLREICKKKNIWMHINGDSLAMMALIHPPGNVYSSKFADSFTITMGTWLGLPALPCATLYKVADPSLVLAASLISPEAAQKLACLPLWVCLQSLGIESIEERIQTSCEMADVMFEELSKINTIRQFSREQKKGEERAIRTISDLITKAMVALLSFDVLSPTIVFRYTESTEPTNIAVAPYAAGGSLEDDEETEEEARRKHEYYNSLNVWLAESVQAENPCVEVTVVDLEREGLCMRFAPLQSAQVLGTSKDDVKAFVRSLKSQISILDATVLNYEKFRLVTAEQENLRLVEVDNWAGLGAVQYIPSEYLDDLNNLSVEALQDISNLNIELIHKLKATDNAFSLGFTDQDVACVKFGLVTDDTDVSELITLVQDIGKQVEESAKYLESMSELVRKGIQEANKDLIVEKQHKIQQEGVLRQLPMIGSMMNWWSPPPKDAERGRTFNLESGTIASTEETYKYKMQLAKGSPRSRTTSSTGSVSSQHSGDRSISTPGSVKALFPASPGGQAPSNPLGEVPSSPGTKTAADIKAGLVNSINEGDLSEGHESLPSPNGNLRLNLDTTETEAET